MSVKTNCPTSGQRNDMVQMFRALSIIAVVMIHTTPNLECQVYCRPFVNFSVATFLFLSGYLTKSENIDWQKLFRKRIIRVVIPYIIWTILYSLPSVYHKGISCVFVNLLTAKAAAPLYYIFVYIQFVLLTPLLVRLAKSKYQVLGWLVSPVSVLLFKYIPLFGGIELNRYVTVIWSVSCLGWFTFYYIGLLLGNKIIDKRYSFRALSVLYLCSIIIQMLEGYGWLLLGDGNCGTQLKLSSLLTSSLFCLIVYESLNRKAVGLKNRFVKLIGDYSFGIYLCHIMVMWILALIPYYNMVAYPVSSAIVVLASLACCYTADRVCGDRFSAWLGLR